MIKKILLLCASTLFALHGMERHEEKLTGTHLQLREDLAKNAMRGEQKKMMPVILKGQ